MCALISFYFIHMWLLFCFCGWQDKSSRQGYTYKHTYICIVYICFSHATAFDSCRCVAGCRIHTYMCAHVGASPTTVYVLGPICVRMCCCCIFFFWVNGKMSVVILAALWSHVTPHSLLWDTSKFLHARIVKTLGADNIKKWVCVCVCVCVFVTHVGFTK